MFFVFWHIFALCAVTEELRMAVQDENIDFRGLSLQIKLFGNIKKNILKSNTSKRLD